MGHSDYVPLNGSTFGCGWSGHIWSMSSIDVGYCQRTSDVVSVFAQWPPIVQKKKKKQPGSLLLEPTHYIYQNARRCFGIPLALRTKWAVFKIPLSSIFQYTGWLIGIPTLDSYNPQYIKASTILQLIINQPSCVFMCQLHLLSYPHIIDGSTMFNPYEEWLNPHKNYQPTRGLGQSPSRLEWPMRVTCKPLSDSRFLIHTCKRQNGDEFYGS